MPLRLSRRSAGFESDFADFLDAKRAQAEDVDRAVAAIIEAVRRDGDHAAIRYTERFDGLTLTPETLRLSDEELATAEGACEDRTLDALRFAAERIIDFHRRQMPEDLVYTDVTGLRLGQRWTAIGAVGLYVPGGLAAYPSSVLMNALPAKVAGVPRIAMTVPTPGGRLNPLVLAAARIAGVDEIYRLGGAQAVAALAHGTRTIAAVDKIVGPGNAYVASAKKQVYGIVGIDAIAGPSEILVVADGDNDPTWIAADLMSQAEHDRSAQAILITDDDAFATAVERAVDRLLQTLPRSDIAGESWRVHGAVILVDDLDQAPELVDRIAPEHLALAVAEPAGLVEQIRNAGAIFMGRHTPEAIGDYVAGPNHVLPTDRTARFSSGLSVLDFLKRSSLIGCPPEGLARVGPAAVELARAEGLDAHALSITLRLNGES
jgi:histidinol dehydrogenase